MRRGAILLLLTLTFGCDQGLRQEVAVLREEVAAHEATIEQLRGRIEELDAALAEERQARRDGDAAREVLPPLPLPSPLPETLAPAIVPQCEGSRCTLTRGELDALLADPSQLARAARVIPAIKDGATLGLKLYGIRPGSILALLGLKNGDLVQEIAGVALKGPDEALAAHAAAKKSERVVVKGSRKDEPFELVLELRADPPADTKKK